jgi:hypothetical protein
MGWVGHVARVKISNVYKIFAGTPEGRPRRRWEGNIKTDLKLKSGRLRTDSNGSGEGPVAGFCKHGNELSGFIKGSECLYLSACEEQLWNSSACDMDVRVSSVAYCPVYGTGWRWADPSVYGVLSYI